jgi:hypothetical protein
MTRSAFTFPRAWAVVAATVVAGSLVVIAAHIPVDAQTRDGDAGAVPGALPRNNMTMQQVRQRFGEPEAESPAVGEPPITRWVYPGYTVYFERDRVLVPVRHDRPLP